MEEELKKKKKEEEDKIKKEMGEDKIKYITMKASVGQQLVFEDIECSRLVYKVLKDRLQEHSDDANF